MLKFSVAAGSLGLMALAVPLQAHAQYGYGYGDRGVRNVQCERQKSSDAAAGTIVGALAGALIGSAIGNEVADDDDHGRYRGYGYGYGRGYRGYDRRRDKNDNDDEVVAGALIGAFIGGAAGNSIASGTGADCQVAYAPGGYSNSGSIPRTTDGLYGGPEVMGSRGGGYRREPYPSSYPSSYPSYPDYPEDRGYREPERDCRVVHRETRLPDGDVRRDPVTACYDERTREWRVQDGYNEGY